MSKIRENMGNPMPVERVMGPNRNNIENYEDLQPIARNVRPSENFSFFLGGGGGGGEIHDI